MLLPMRQNEIPSAIVETQLGGCKLQNNGRVFGVEVAETV